MLRTVAEEWPLMATSGSKRAPRLDTGALPSSNRSTPGGWSIWRPDPCPPDGVHSNIYADMSPEEPTGNRHKGPQNARKEPLFAF
jgi:hypothetical protein